MDKMMGGGKRSYLAMKTSDGAGGSEVISSDLKEVGHALKKLADHTVVRLGGIGFGTSFLKWVAAFAAMLSTNLGPNKLENQHTYIPLDPIHFPKSSDMVIQPAEGRGREVDCFNRCRVTTFLPQTFSRYWLELPGALILLLVVAPGFFADTIRGNMVGTFICLAIGCYLLQEHIRASGGFRNSFTKSNGISNSVGILLLFLYPVWTLVLYLL
ncbi:hypothetical protein OROMI_031582 [Orobanche minor]